MCGGLRESNGHGPHTQRHAGAILNLEHTRTRRDSGVLCKERERGRCRGVKGEQGARRLTSKRTCACERERIEMGLFFYMGGTAGNW